MKISKKAKYLDNSLCHHPDVMFHDPVLQICPSLVPHLRLAEGVSLSQFPLELLAEVCLTDQLVRDELLQDVLVQGDVLQDLVRLDPVDQIRLLVVKLGQDDVEDDVLQILHLLGGILLDTRGVINLSEVSTNIQIVTFMLTQLNHVSRNR